MLNYKLKFIIVNYIFIFKENHIYNNTMPAL